MKRQTHTVHVVFPGHFDDFLRYLEECGVKFDFIPPGLKNSDGIVEVFPHNLITSEMLVDGEDGLIDIDKTNSNQDRVSEQYKLVKSIDE